MFPSDPVDGGARDPFDPAVHPRPRKGTQIGLAAEIALMLIAEAGGEAVTLKDLPPGVRHFLNSKAHVLDQAALITTERGAIRDGRAEPDRYTLTPLGRDMVEHLHAAARP
jgi:hypothetical protein